MSSTDPISRTAPNPSLGITAPQPECSCQGGTIAGIGSGTVRGTTYSWCETGGLPSGVPPEATNAPVKNGPAPVATTAAPNPVPLASQCVHVFTDPPQHTAICSTSTQKNDLSTPLPDGMWSCISRGLGTECFCQAEGNSQPCLPADQIAKGQKRNVPRGGPEPTAAPILQW